MSYRFNLKQLFVVEILKIAKNWISELLFPIKVLFLRNNNPFDSSENRLILWASFRWLWFVSDTLRIKTTIIDEIAKHLASFRLYLWRDSIQYSILHLRNSIRKVPFFWVLENFQFFPKNDSFINKTKRKPPLIMSKGLRSYIVIFSDYGIIEKVD